MTPSDSNSAIVAVAENPAPGTVKVEPCSFSARPHLLPYEDQTWVKVAVVATVLVLVASFILPGITRGEFHINIDEAYHATTGLYFADFFRDLPLSHPVHYTYMYYVQYPALGLIHWPPLFHIIEGISFLLFGASAVTARATSFAFALLGLFFWFRLVRELDNPWSAAATTIVLAALPPVLLYEKAVMLEMPSLALGIAATYYWTRYLRSEQARPACWFAVFAGLALLTKQQAIYLALLCAFSLLGTRKWHLLWSKRTILAGAICAFIATPFYLLSFAIDTQSIKANVFQGLEPIRHPYLYYPQALPHQLGIMLLVLSAAGLLTYWWWRAPRVPPVMLAWVLGWYVTFTLIGTKTDRYVVYWLPPFVYFAVAPFASTMLRRPLRQLGAVVLAALILASSWQAWHFQRPYVVGARQLAHQLVETTPGGVLLYDGDLAANFIFYMRASDPARHFVVLRKALFATRVMSEFGSEELVHSPAELEDLLEQYGVRYVIVESNEPLEFRAQRILRDALKTPQFRLVREIPIRSNVAPWNTISLLLYENQKVVSARAPMLQMKMLSTGEDIAVPLATLLHDPDRNVPRR